MLDPAPPVVGEGFLALISLMLALGQPARVRRAFRWAGHYRPRFYPRVMLTLTLLRIAVETSRWPLTWDREVRSLSPVD